MFSSSSPVTERNSSVSSPFIICKSFVPSAQNSSRCCRVFSTIPNRVQFRSNPNERWVTKMASQNESAQELLVDVKVAEASRLRKFYLNNEKTILGSIAVAIFLVTWELVGNVFQLINPMFMSAPSLIAKAAVELVRSG